MSKNRKRPQIGVKIANLWNHRLEHNLKEKMVQ